MIRRILHSHYFFVSFFPSSSSSSFSFVLFVRSALNFAPLSTTCRKSIAGSWLLSDKEAFCCHSHQHDLYINFFKEYQKTGPFPCFFYIIDRANFKKMYFQMTLAFIIKKIEKKFLHNYLSNSMYHTLSTLEIKYVS